MVGQQRVCIIGSGNWGSAIAKIVGANASKLNNFEDRVTMYVYEEMIDGKKLTEIINETHENVKYLPGHKIPANVMRTQMAMQYLQTHSVTVSAANLRANGC